MRRVFCYDTFMRSIVIVDGSNFYYKLKELGLSSHSAFDYPGFVSYLTQNTEVVAKYYCIGKIRAKQEDTKARQLMAEQQAFVTKLTKQGFYIQFGYLLKSATYHEKGVDVQIATDLLKGAFKDQFDQAYLLSSDSDLLPSIVETQTLGKTVTYVGFAHKPSFALLRTCKTSRLLTKEDLLPFLPPKM